MGFAPICLIPKCPRRTCVRITDGDTRKDMCLLHGVITMFHYRNSEEVKVVEYWNGINEPIFKKAIREYSTLKDYAINDFGEDNG